MNKILLTLLILAGFVIISGVSYIAVKNNQHALQQDNFSEDTILITELRSREFSCIEQANISYGNLVTSMCKIYEEPLGDDCSLPQDIWSAIINIRNEFMQSCNKMSGR